MELFSMFESICNNLLKYFGIYIRQFFDVDASFGLLMLSDDPQQIFPAIKGSNV
jgi:hypothetical protein